jgi:hypothetical protein
MGGATRAQLALEWTDELRWDEVPAPLRGEVRAGAVLRDLLRRAARDDSSAESGHDE